MKHFDFVKEYSYDDIERCINQWVKHERNRQIMKSKLLDGLTFEKIAEKYDLSDRYVKTLIYRLEMQVFEHLE